SGFRSPHMQLQDKTITHNSICLFYWVLSKVAHTQLQNHTIFNFSIGMQTVTMNIFHICVVVYTRNPTAVRG
uniref:Uncharacterized protein n=1 Tax=Amphiprion percula TaxID=161767 RepID=A0A3P8SD76_AMPPE